MRINGDDEGNEHTLLLCLRTLKTPRPPPDDVNSCLMASYCLLSIYLLICILNSLIYYFIFVLLGVAHFKSVTRSFKMASLSHRICIVHRVLGDYC